MVRRVVQAVVAVGLVVAALLLRASPPHPTAAQAPSVALTIYDNETALVTERRQVTVPTGNSEVPFLDVPTGIDPTSVLLRPLDAPRGFRVVAQRYRHDYASTHEVLKQFEGQPIQLTTEDGNRISGTLELSGGDVLVQQADGHLRIARADKVQEFTLPPRAEPLVARPTLFWEVEATQAGRVTAELTYLTQRLGWRADYIARLNAAETALELHGWATLTNRSGASFPDATIELVAAEYRAASAVDELRRRAALEATLPLTETLGTGVVRYHSYPLGRAISLADREIKQVALLAAPAVPVVRRYIFDGGRLRFPGYLISDPAFAAGTANSTVEVAYDLTNGAAAGLGTLLPAGRVRLYAVARSGQTQFLGEDRIEHREVDEQVRLRAGVVPELVGTRAPTGFRRIGETAIEESFSITVRNEMAAAAEVRVVEHLFRWRDWRITAESVKHNPIAPDSVEFPLTVPARGSATVTYTVRYTLP